MGKNGWIGILTAVGLSAALLGARGLGPAAVLCVYVAAVTAPLITTDVRERRLPNALVLPGYAFAAVATTGEVLARGSPGALAAGWACGAGVLLFLAVPMAGGGLGMGDVKLAGLLGTALASVVAGAGAGVCASVGAGADRGAAAAGAVGGLDAGVGAAAGAVGVWLGAAFATLLVVGVVEWAGGARGAGREVAFGPVLLGSFWVVALCA